MTLARKSKTSSDPLELVWQGSEDLRPLLVPIATLAPDPANVRTHPERNVQAIRASLMRFGQQKPVVCDSHGIVRAGNGTLDAARSLGWTHLARVVTSLEGSEATAYSIADNRTSDLAAWDVESLVAQLQALEADAIDPATLGFDGEDIAGLMDASQDGEVPDFQPVSEDEQGRLDQKASITCPKCGHEFTT